MSPSPAAVTLSRGRRLDLGRPDYYQDLLTGIIEEILDELASWKRSTWNPWAGGRNTLF